MIKYTCIHLFLSWGGKEIMSDTNELNNNELEQVSGGEFRYTDKYCGVCKDALKTKVEIVDGVEKTITYCPVCGWIRPY